MRKGRGGNDGARGLDHLTHLLPIPINQLINQSINQTNTFARAPVTDDHWRRTSRPIT